VSVDVDVEALVDAAWEFQYVAEQLRIAKGHADDGDGKGSAFGLLLNTTGMGGKHDRHIAQMTAALAAGIREANRFHTTLVTIARHFGATDAEISARFATLDKYADKER
jgi:hypothetical protein